MPTKLPLLGGGEREPALLLSDEELSCLDYVAGYFTNSKPLVSRLIGSVATKARSAPADSVVVRREDVLPNPLSINFGDGRMLVSKFRGNDGERGLVFEDTGEPHEVGSPDGTPPGYRDHSPQKGEVYLTFRNQKSAAVVLTSLLETMYEWAAEAEAALKGAE